MFLDMVPVPIVLFGCVEIHCVELWAGIGGGPREWLEGRMVEFRAKHPPN